MNNLPLCIIRPLDRRPCKTRGMTVYTKPISHARTTHLFVCLVAHIIANYYLVHLDSNTHVLLNRIPHIQVVLEITVLSPIPTDEYPQYKIPNTTH